MISLNTFEHWKSYFCDCHFLSWSSHRAWQAGLFRLLRKHKLSVVYMERPRPASLQGLPSVGSGLGTQLLFPRCVPSPGIWVATVARTTRCSGRGTEPDSRHRRQGASSFPEALTLESLNNSTRSSTLAGETPGESLRTHGKGSLGSLPRACAPRSARKAILDLQTKLLTGWIPLGDPRRCHGGQKKSPTGPSLNP